MKTGCGHGIPRGGTLLTIVLASKNEGKIREVTAILRDTDVNLLSLHNYPPMGEIAEDGSTFTENALIKARSVSDFTGGVALADDSGLAVDALAGAPGVYSARYAGPAPTDARNVAKLLHDLRDVPAGMRGASFVCALVLYYPGGKYFTCEGRWPGEIALEPAGENGFGYDPVFFLPERGLTSAQLPPAVKNMISHRARALTILKEALSRGQLPIRA